MVKDNAKNNRIENMNDDGFGIAIREHSGEYFITEDVSKADGAYKDLYGNVLSPESFDGDKYYTLSSVGQFTPIYVGEEDDYRSLGGHKWNGGDYGFLIDGMLISGEDFARMWSANEGWTVRFQAVDAYDDVLKADEYLMPVSLSEKALVDDTLELINMFCHDGTFISNHDRRNFIKLFDRVLDKLKFYHENNPRGYGKLAGMGIIKRLEWIEGTEALADKVREIITS